MRLIPVLAVALVAICAALWRKLARDGDTLSAYLRYPILAIAAAIAVDWVGYTSSHDRVFGGVALLAFAGFVGGGVFLAGAAIVHARKERRREAGFAGASALLLFAVASVALFVEPTRLQVTRYAIRRGLPAELSRERLRIVVLADIQTDAPGAYEEEVLRRAAALGGDLYLFPGDYVQSPRARYEEDMARLRELIAAAGFPEGVSFAVQGDVDWQGRWRDVFDGTSIETFEASETRRPLPGVTVRALSYVDSHHPGLRYGAPRGAEDELRIAFGHRPAFALGDVDADVLIAGHTHGGQLQLPLFGPVVTLSAVPRAWAEGLTELEGGRTLIVSRGIGMERGEAPPVRFLCPPEIVVVDIGPGEG